VGFGADWEVVYCSRPTSPGAGYRSVIGRLFFKTKEMIQAIDAPDIVRNKVSINAFGFLDGDVSLTGDYCKIHICIQSHLLPCLIFSPLCDLICREAESVGQ